MKRIWKAQAILIAFWCACGVTLYLALAPAEPAMAWLGNDKVQHAALRDWIMSYLDRDSMQLIAEDILET